MSEWVNCVIVGCDCKRRPSTPARSGVCEDEWICGGHWAMAKKSRRSLYIRATKRLSAIYGDTHFDVVDERKIVRLWRYLWYRLKNEITQKAMGI